MFHLLDCARPFGFNLYLGKRDVEPTEISIRGFDATHLMQYVD